ncbi:MAG: 4Fe-4S ferredoxin [Candidatus Eisenbacteria bacterium]|nr:4Fe-4S ferredoxin [Candidatus Eisenbacteria bacterium]
MCEFCHKHGEGKKWYLQAKNYSDDLMSDLKRRRFIGDFFSRIEHLSEEARSLDRFAKAPPLVKSLVRSTVTRRMKREHFGQVVPIEEVEQIFGFTNSIVRLACVCRLATVGKEKRFCYGISLEADGGEFSRLIRGLDQSYASGPNTVGLESLSREQAIDAFREHDRRGLCHSVWTFRTPFIAGICNCDRADCLAMRSTVTHGIKVMFRAEYVGAVDPDLCAGCRDCLRSCQFGAISYSPATEKAVIDQIWCYGCGVCRAACRKDAIRLVPREEVPAAAGVW